mmetsp:Transcript_5007/g.18799  ORF Transcript_5007/g.18799 Transcript_5007/m.18799 type:complete len:262 (+) Transcript_5007:554-1339(+)
MENRNGLRQAISSVMPLHAPSTSPLIRQVFAIHPKAKPLIEKFRLDFQGKPILELFQNDEEKAEQLIREIESCMGFEAPTKANIEDRKSTRVLAVASPPQLVQWVEDRFDKKLRIHSFPRIQRLLDNVMDKNEYSRVLNATEGDLRQLIATLSNHIVKDENGLFQDLVVVERSMRAPSVDVASLMRACADDWEKIRGFVSNLRQSSEHYQVPLSAESSSECQELFSLLRELDSDLQEYCVAENLILFPLFSKSTKRSQEIQ